MKIRLAFPILLPMSLIAACASDDVHIGSLQEVVSMPAVPNRDLDVLFVIDNSPSMGDNQRALARSFQRVVEHLDQLDGGRPNLHLGVVTTDMGTNNAAGTPAPAIGTLGQGGCVGVGRDGALVQPGTATDELYLSDITGSDGQRVRNYTGELADQFAKLAVVGDGGCGFEQPLAAMRRAFTQPDNVGFLRPDANLAVVIVGDEDDCSALDPAMFSSSGALGPLTSFRCFAQGVVCDEDLDQPGEKRHCVPRGDSAHIEPVAEFRDALLALKPDPRQIMLAAIIGDPTPVVVGQAIDAGESTLELTPSCTYNEPSGPAEASPAIRLASLVDSFPGAHQRSSICSADLDASLDAIGGAAKALIGDPCLPASNLVDSSPAAGLQPACEVTQDTGGTPAELELSPCEAVSGGSCFKLVADPVTCPYTPDHLRVSIHLTDPLPANARAHVKCQLND